MVNFATLGEKNSAGGDKPAAPDYCDQLIHEIETEESSADHSPFIPGSGPAPVEAIDGSDEAPDSGIAPTDPVFGAPLITMWLAPRRTIRGVLHEGSFIVVLLLGALAGAAGTLSGAIGADETPVLSELLLDSLTLGPLMGIFVLLAGAGVFWLSGKLFSGQARFSDLCAVTAWSRVPVLSMGLFLLVTILVVGPAVLTGSRLEVWLLLIGNFTFAIWSTVLFVGALAEAQGWTIGKAIVNALVTALATALIMFTLLFLLGLLVGLAVALSAGMG